MSDGVVSNLGRSGKEKGTLSDFFKFGMRKVIEGR